MFELDTTVYKTFIKKCIFDDSAEIKSRLPFYRYVSKFWDVSGGLCTQAFYSCVRADLKSSVT